MTRRFDRCGKRKRDLRWSTREDELLRKLYPDYRALRERLPHRTIAALKNRLRVLGVARRRHIWTNHEVADLRKAYVDGVRDVELPNLFPGLRLTQIKNKACHIRAERRRPRQAHFDEPALDAIRARSRAMGMSLVELDRLARTGSFFQQSRRRVSLKPIVRAAKALGAEVQIEWTGDTWT